MAGNSDLPRIMDEDEPSTWSMILSTIITIVTLVGLWYCFRRASTLFPRAISIPLDNFMQGQRSRRRGPIALDDDDWRDAEVLEEGLFVEDNVDDNEHDDDDDDYDHVNDHHHNNNNHRYRSYNHETDTRDGGGSRPLLPVTTADTQRFSLEIEGEEDEDDEEVEQDRRVLGRKEEDVSTTMVYDIGGDDEDNSDDEEDENTAIRTPYKDDDDEDVKK